MPIPAHRLAACALACLVIAAPAGADPRDAVRAKVAAEYASLRALYEHLHRNPELSLVEVNTAALMAKELRAAGVEVTEKVGGHGVVGVLRNGPGPTVLLRADMDGLPVKETTGLPYASTAIVKDSGGKEQPAMHACGHDVHMTGLVGTARTLTALKSEWSGTVVFVLQPAEEIVAGARAMLADGLYARFPKPDAALALHTEPALPAGTLGYREGAYMAGVSSVDIVVRGVGGHGSAPHTAKDPVVLAAQIVLALQTIVSREIAPGTPAVVTVGTIAGGTKRNIIPDDVRLELTLRAFDSAVMEKLIASIRRITEGLARAAGVPDDRLPTVTVTKESSDPVVNDPETVRRLTGAFKTWFGEARVQRVEPVHAAEDFTYYGRTAEQVPIFLWRVGTTAPEKLAERDRTGVAVPSLHNAGFAPVVEPTLTAAVTSLTAATLELLAKKGAAGSAP